MIISYVNQQGCRTNFQIKNIGGNWYSYCHDTYYSQIEIKEDITGVLLYFIILRLG